MNTKRLVSTALTTTTHIKYKATAQLAQDETDTEHRTMCERSRKYESERRESDLAYVPYGIDKKATVF